jgi:hypothetical protein
MPTALGFATWSYALSRASARRCPELPDPRRRDPAWLDVSRRAPVNPRRRRRQPLPRRRLRCPPRPSEAPPLTRVSIERTSTKSPNSRNPTGASSKTYARHESSLHDARCGTLLAKEEVQPRNVALKRYVRPRCDPMSPESTTSRIKKPLVCSRSAKPLTDSNRRPLSMKKGRGSSSGVGIAQSGRVVKSAVASWAHLSIASSWGRTRPIGVRSGGASP